MTTVKHVQSTDYPNGKAETARMFAYAREIGLYPPFTAGDRVEILVGGHRGELGVIRHINCGLITVTLDTGMLLAGFIDGDLRRLA